MQFILLPHLLLWLIKPAKQHRMLLHFLKIDVGCMLNLLCPKHLLIALKASTFRTNSNIANRSRFWQPLGTLDHNTILVSHLPYDHATFYCYFQKYYMHCSIQNCSWWGHLCPAHCKTWRHFLIRSTLYIYTLLIKSNFKHAYLFINENCRSCSIILTYTSKILCTKYKASFK